MVAEGKDESVALCYCVGRDRDGATISDDGGALLADESKLVDDMLSTEIVDDANEGIGDGDSKEKEVAIATTSDENQNRENEVDKVKNSEGVPGDEVESGRSRGFGGPGRFGGASMRSDSAGFSGSRHGGGGTDKVCIVRAGGQGRKCRHRWLRDRQRFF